MMGKTLQELTIADNTHYDVEMQVAKKEALAKRTRYYHSQMDMELLVKGKDYSELPKACVIFICDFDQFEEKKYRYTFQGRCDEKEELLLGDERFTIFLSTKGENTDEVSQELIAFLDYVKANLAESTQEFNDNYVRQLQDSVKQIKKSREMGVRYDNVGVRHQFGQPNVNLRKEAEKNERILQEAESCIK